MTRTGIFDLWLWPLEAARTTVALTETLTNAHAVIGARAPIINAALADPLAADVSELSRMVTEKWDAFGKAASVFSTAQHKQHGAMSANFRDMERLAGGALFGPAAWLRLVERNLALWSALAALPGTMLQPIRTSVAGNARRLRG